jgi:5-methylcytosine-specific restriction protein A
MLPAGYSGEADSVPNKQTKLSRKLSLAELRALAKNTAPAKATTKQTTQTVLIRSEAVRLYALKRAEGICEGCEQPALFEGKNGPFLEVHHLHRLSDGGPDEPENVAAICPNCHRRAHVSNDHAEYNDYLVARIKKIEFSL